VNTATVGVTHRQENAPRSKAGSHYANGEREFPPCPLHPVGTGRREKKEIPYHLMPDTRHDARLASRGFAGRAFDWPGGFV